MLMTSLDIFVCLHWQCKLPIYEKEQGLKHSMR